MDDEGPWVEVRYLDPVKHKHQIHIMRREAANRLIDSLCPAALDTAQIMELSFNKDAPVANSQI